MPELRHDPIQKRWVIISEERGHRPMDLPERQELDPHGFCPFCAGNEQATPSELYAVRAAGAAFSDWKLRVVPNKYPALRIEGGLDREGMGIYDRMNGVGAHEVVIESPEHQLHMADMSIDHLTAVLTSYQIRLRDLMLDHRLKYIQVFKNHGLAAGASLMHPHSQIIATPVTPRTMAIELDSARRHHQLKERCIYCDMIRQEILDEKRIVSLRDDYIAFAPYASRFAFETVIFPRLHQHDFSELTPAATRSLAITIRDILGRLREGLDNPPFNFILHTAPNIHHEPKRAGYWDTLRYDYHWYIEILPRLTHVAGFEWGTGYYINPTSPENAAAFMRDIHLSVQS